MPVLLRLVPLLTVGHQQWLFLLRKRGHLGGPSWYGIDRASSVEEHLSHPGQEEALVHLWDLMDVIADASFKVFLRVSRSCRGSRDGDDGAPAGLITVLCPRVCPPVGLHANHRELSCKTFIFDRFRL